METVTQKTVADLVTAIDAMMADPKVAPAEWLTNGYAGERPESVNQVVWLAEELLITSAGRPDHTAMATIAATSGYRVVRGESDSFGWLTGVILTPKGRVVYG